MRIALLSDIHGNLIALETALADIENIGVDQVICLGDTALFGPQPQECLARLRELNCPVVMGNTDAWALNPEYAPDPDALSQRYYDLEGWGAGLLTEDDKAYIRTFQPTVCVDLDETTVLLCYHGSPKSFMDSIVADTSKEVLDGYFEESRATVMAGGHTHTQMLRRYRGSYLLNPGSVGLPFSIDPVTGKEINPAYAEYALLTWHAGSLSVDFRRVPYALDVLKQAVSAADMPQSDWWLADWV